MEDVRSLCVRCKTHFSVICTGLEVGPNLYDLGKHSLLEPRNLKQTYRLTLMQSHTVFTKYATICTDEVIGTYHILLMISSIGREDILHWACK